MCVHTIYLFSIYFYLLEDGDSNGSSAPCNVNSEQSSVFESDGVEMNPSKELNVSVTGCCHFQDILSFFSFAV